uniref:Uncharacterized protein n=1 Tax=Arundo donax TaxID=35708 RepID=A0A0A9GNL5_ARUDO
MKIVVHYWSMGHTRQTCAVQGAQTLTRKLMRADLSKFGVRPLIGRLDPHRDSIAPSPQTLSKTSDSHLRA